MKQRTVTPNFFVVGATKAGTSSIHHYLSQHPDVYISPIKEPHFFSKDICAAGFSEEYNRRTSFDIEAYLKTEPLPPMHIAHIVDMAHYLELFRDVRNEKAIGELSTGYLYSNCAADNLFHFNPAAKIVMVLRQPVYRAYSHYLMAVRDLWDYESGFVDALERDMASKEKGWGKSHLYFELGMYSDQVRRYLNRFPAGQVKILLYDDLAADPPRFMAELFEFLELNLSAIGSMTFSERKNAAMLPRFKMSRFHQRFFNTLKRSVGGALPPGLKARAKKMMLSHRAPPKLQKAEFEHALRYFGEDIQELSALIKRDLRQWYQP
jgi:hypothetical protein